MSPSSAALAFEAEMAMAHIPVLTSELMGLLQIEADSRVVDCTFGAGGHASAVAARIGPQGRLIACDRDPVAEAYFETLRGSFRSPTTFYAGNFADTLRHLRDEDFTATHVYMDLGLSSMQVDTEERGFSYGYDAPLDMRMDPTLVVTAADIINSESEAELSRLFRVYGEEQYAHRIARAVARRRQRTPFTRTAELVETIKQAIPTPARFGARNPARRVFQALRIAVNDELESLKRALPEALELLESGGVLAVISFHSLEDRIVKQFFQSQARPCICPPSLPVCACGKVPTLEILTPRPLTPKARERQANPRSGSAKLRAARRL